MSSLCVSLHLSVPYLSSHYCRAHDRALIRAIGPSNCRANNLNYPVAEYSSEPLSRFMEFDEKLKAQLFLTSWKGLKHCDFGFLLVRGAQNQGHASLQMLYQTQKMAMLSTANTPTSSAAKESDSNVLTSPFRSNTRGAVAAAVANTASTANNAITVPPSLHTLVPSLIPTPSTATLAFSSGSLKSKIVMDVEIERNKVPPPPFGATICVANVPAPAPVGSVSATPLVTSSPIHST